MEMENGDEGWEKVTFFSTGLGISGVPKRMKMIGDYAIG
jgi:hypothetical protein